MDLKGYLKQRQVEIDEALAAYLPDEDLLPSSLHRAMRYSVFAGGKRLRPVLLLAACEAVGGDYRQAMPAACAMEMIHTYSLIHDDLPVMDDDDFRRGRPTNHKVFGEATAVLAGDALLTEAFILLADRQANGHLPADTVREVIRIIAGAAGSLGMVGGQVVDMEAEGKPIDLPLLEFMHTHKTGALILACLQAGGRIGKADEAALASLSAYGTAAGLAFQIADDILDIVGEQAVLGKDVGSDQARGKATYPALLGLTEARSRALELRDRAVAALEPLGEKAEPLRQIAHYIIDRSS